LHHLADLFFRFFTLTDLVSFFDRFYGDMSESLLVFIGGNHDLA